MRHITGLGRSLIARSPWPYALRGHDLTPMTPRRAQGLQHEAVRSADVLSDFNPNLAVAEGRDLGLAELDAEVVHYRLREGRICISCEELYLLHVS